MQKSIHSETTELFAGLQAICEYISKNNYEEPQVVMQQALMRVAKLSDAYAGNVRIYDEDSDQLILKASYGISEKYRTAKPALPVGTSAAGLAFETEQMYVLEDLTKNNVYRSPEFALQEGVTSLISIPLMTTGKKLGVLSLYYSATKKFTTQEKDFFDVLANFLAISFNTHRLHHQVQHSSLNTAKMFVNALEEKDVYSAGHSKRVRKYAVKLAEGLGLAEGKIKLLAEMSALHDIGKIVIDTAILNKSGDLTDAEWEVIKHHPMLGARMLNPIDYFIDGISLVSYHHERIDGSGYPDGLGGSSIPLLARIISIADAYDAMTSDRPYRDRLSEEDARKELKRNAGTQFDRDLVNVFLNLLDT